jgi:hypothetical protein
MMRLLFFAIIPFLFSIHKSCSFTLCDTRTHHLVAISRFNSFASSSTEKITKSRLQMSSTPGDKVRDSTGKRPSLNPTIINAISEALSKRASNDSSLPMEVTPDVEPIQVAVAAGQIASSAIEKRAKSSTAVAGDESSAFTPEECQLVAGRIIGVVMRWNEIEASLIEAVKSTAWVLKYNEQASFGVLSEECEDGECDDTILKKRLQDDPLLRMCRAECLYALFLKNVEMPTMEKIGQVPIDGATGIDFLDAERKEVLFPDGFE